MEGKQFGENFQNKSLKSLNFEERLREDQKLKLGDDFGEASDLFCQWNF